MWDIKLCYTHWADGQWTCLMCGSVVEYSTMELHTRFHHPHHWPPVMPPNYARLATA